MVTVTGLLVWQGGYYHQVLRDGRVLGDRVQDWRAAAVLVARRACGTPALVFVRSGLIEADGLGIRDDPLLREYCLLPVRGIYDTGIEGERLIPLPMKGSGRGLKSRWRHWQRRSKTVIERSHYDALKRRSAGWSGYRRSIQPTSSKSPPASDSSGSPPKSSTPTSTR